VDKFSQLCGTCQVSSLPRLLDLSTSIPCKSQPPSIWLPMKTWISYLHTTHGFVVTICLKPCVFSLAFQSLNPLDLSSTTRMTRLERSPRHLLVDLWYFTSRFQKNQENLGMYNQLARWLWITSLIQTHAFWFAYLRKIRVIWHLWRSPIRFFMFQSKT